MPEVMEKNEIRIMDAKEGDIKLEWDSAHEDECVAARQAFNNAKRKGYLFYKTKKDGTKGELLKEFDEYAERIVGMPAIQGG